MECSLPGFSVHGLFQARLLEWGAIAFSDLLNVVILYIETFLVAEMVKHLPTHNAGDPGSIPGSGRSPGEGNGNPLQYSCLQNPMDRGAW